MGGRVHDSRSSFAQLELPVQLHPAGYGCSEMEKRPFDVILYGATGFTGRQTVRYFEQYAPPGVRWAVAGRNRGKLQALGASVPVLVADSTDPREAAALAAQTRVMLSTAGPFELFGDRLVEACVKAQTHYVDITGEVAWVRSLIDRFHVTAERDGTKIVPFCGFDSVPADLGVLFLRQHLGEELAEAKAYFQAKGGRPNGGTIASAHHTYSSGADKAGRDPFLLCPGFQRALFPLEVDPSRASFDSDVNAWVAPFPMSILDSRVVRRSSLLADVDFPYQEFAIFTGVLAPVWARAAAAGTGLFFAVLRSPATRNLARRMMGAGGGPSDDAMNGGYFTCRVWGRTRAGQTGEVLLRCAGDPANRVTVLCVCENALALVCNPDELPARAGVLTPSTGIGNALVTRLRNREFTFQVLR